VLLRDVNQLKTATTDLEPYVMYSKFSNKLLCHILLLPFVNHIKVRFIILLLLDDNILTLFINQSSYCRNLGNNSSIRDKTVITVTCTARANRT